MEEDTLSSTLENDDLVALFSHAFAALNTYQPAIRGGSVRLFRRWWFENGYQFLKKVEDIVSTLPDRCEDDINEDTLCDDLKMIHQVVTRKHFPESQSASSKLRKLAKALKTGQTVRSVFSETNVKYLKNLQSLIKWGDEPKEEYVYMPEGSSTYTSYISQRLDARIPPSISLDHLMPMLVRKQGDCWMVERNFGVMEEESVPLKGQGTTDWLFANVQGSIYNFLCHALPGGQAYIEICLLHATSPRFCRRFGQRLCRPSVKWYSRPMETLWEETC